MLIMENIKGLIRSQEYEIVKNKPISACISPDGFHFDIQSMNLMGLSYPAPQPM